MEGKKVKEDRKGRSRKDERKRQKRRKWGEQEAHIRSVPRKKANNGRKGRKDKTKEGGKE